MRTRRRREFSIADQVAIVARATDEGGKIRCEQCGAWCKSRKDYEIDHTISEGIRPTSDKRRKLTAADEQLLCAAVCHKAKTARDVGDIGQAKRREARAAGIERPGKVEMARRAKPEKKQIRVAPGAPGMARTYR